MTAKNKDQKPDSVTFRFSTTPPNWSRMTGGQKVLNPCFEADRDTGWRSGRTLLISR